MAVFSHFHDSLSSGRFWAASWTFWMPCCIDSWFCCNSLETADVFRLQMVNSLGLKLPFFLTTLLSPFLCMVVQTLVHFSQLCCANLGLSCACLVLGFVWDLVGTQVTGAPSSPSFGSLFSGTASSCSNLLRFSWPQRLQSFHWSFSHLCCTALHGGLPSVHSCEKGHPQPGNSPRGWLPAIISMLSFTFQSSQALFLVLRSEFIAIIIGNLGSWRLTLREMKVSVE